MIEEIDGYINETQEVDGYINEIIEFFYYLEIDPPEDL